MKTTSHTSCIKDFTRKSRLMASLFISREIRLSGMFEILALKEFTFACLDDRKNILYSQGHEEASVYCENAMHYPVQGTNCLGDRFEKAISLQGPHERDFYAGVSRVVHVRAW